MKLNLYELFLGTHVILLAQVKFRINNLRSFSESLTVRARCPIQDSLIVNRKLAIENNACFQRIRRRNVRSKKESRHLGGN